jgi:DNA-binding CsgD family transcriptional regulator
MVGFGCYWAWIENSFSTAILYHHQSGEFALALVHLSTCALAVLVLSVLLPGRRLARRFSNRLLVTNVLLASSSSCCLVLASTTGSVYFLVWTVFAGGASMALLGVVWGVTLSNYGGEGGSICVPGAIALAAFIGVVISQASLLLAVALTMALPVISVALLVIVRRAALSEKACDGATKKVDEGSTQKAASRSSSLWGKVPPRFVIILFLFCAAFGIMQYLIVIPAQNADQISRMNILFRGLVALLFLVGLGVFSWKPLVVFQVGFLIITAGFLVVPFVRTGAITSAIIMIGYTCFDMLSWIVICSLAVRQGADAPRIVALARFASLSGVLIGALTGLVLTYWAPLEGLDIAVVANAVAYLLVVATALSMDRGPTGFWLLLSEAKQSAASTSQEMLQRAVDQIAARAALTPREREFFGYLALGRTIPWINEHLSISEGTGRTHTQHIYVKLHVHSRQELLDMVETTISALQDT